MQGQARHVGQRQLDHGGNDQGKPEVAVGKGEVRRGQHNQLQGHDQTDYRATKPKKQRLDVKSTMARLAEKRRTGQSEFHASDEVMQ